MSKLLSLRSKKSTASGGSSEFYRPTKKTGSKLSILRRRKQKDPEVDCQTLLEEVEKYKDSADKLHASLVNMFVEGPVYARQLACVRVPRQIPCDPCYKYLSDYLYHFDILLKKGHKGVYEPLQPVISACREISEEQLKYVRRQLENIQPLSRFIGDDYWEFSRLKGIYMYYLERLDTAQKNFSKQENPETENAEKTARIEKEEAKTKMMKSVNMINKKKEIVAQCVIRVQSEATSWHQKVASIIEKHKICTDPEEKKIEASKSTSSENSKKSQISIK